MNNVGIVILIKKPKEILMICNRCGVQKELGKGVIWKHKTYCKHCYGAVTRGYSVITDY